MKRFPYISGSYNSYLPPVAGPDFFSAGISKAGTAELF